ncbi:MAG: ATP-binding cassette domain-containing protein [Bacteroidetes bacterium]|nr:MAG: ATP-binding cassette domain-containing protein [Bacteroidota bacterium]MBL1144231.1 ATP-binding cassette domain-containing protein [Bacteroidota bacterium]NOG57027.1 ATP-binding cassette domain-containing protein [Bacteroidota bacterium]
MSERILKALMQLFAIMANVGRDDSNSREFVRQFLEEQLNRDLVNEYLLVYDRYYNEQNKKREGLKARKRTSLNSVKILKICMEINKELTQKQKIYVLVQLLEFIYQNDNDTEQAMEFVDTVADSFNINKTEFNNAKDFVKSEANEIPKYENLLLINNHDKHEGEHFHIKSDKLQGQIHILNIRSVNMFFLKYFGTTETLLNGQIIRPKKTYVLTQGSSIRASNISPIYYSDIINKFLSDSSSEKTSFTIDNITYKFKNGNIGLYPMSLEEESGDLIGIMGASGAGKSTLLNVLNGNYKPTKGSVRINGFDVHEPSNKDKIEGVIGYVSQDDLLIEELTVFQNIFYNAKLCFGDLSDFQIAKLTFKILHSLGLYETRHLKVGSPLEKTISGGQRKRVNIGLELIREPSILFVDEPTSGLSSRDSENIMDLLKELTLRGKLIFVVIHQPSSDIFKMFDKLIILDTGGHLIYNGNPVDAIVYFKKQIQQANAVESECIQCGNVNPEQIFNIIESKILDEYGNQTDKRRVKPKEWSKKYKEANKSNHQDVEVNTNPPISNLKIPNAWKQFLVFIKRDVLSKLTNKQYLLINFLEAPVLGFILSFIIKYSSADSTNVDGYIFRLNENLTAYIFMSVIVALFLGLTVSAEEIIRDRKILKREKFLNLSKGSYLFSKIFIMFTVSAIQVLTFVLVGNTVLEIKGMYFEYWLILFSVSCFANMLGLNISSSFDSAVTIYILIPFLIIPQLLLSGVIVKFDKLNPVITIQKKVPMAGEIMASKWAFEALSVNQFKNNKFNQQFYFIDKDLKNASFKKNFWLTRIKDKLNFIIRNKKNTEAQEELNNAYLLLANEFSKENEQNSQIQFPDIESLTVENMSEEQLSAISDYINELSDYYIDKYNHYSDVKDELLIKLNKTDEDKALFIKMKNEYTNESLENLLTNKNDLDKIIEWDNELIQRADPIYKDPIGFRAHFLAPSKKLFGTNITTFSANLLVLWFFSIVLAITLYYDVLRKLLDFIGNLFNKKSY